jgi:hypothetical protein
VLDVLTNPESTDTLDSPSHAGQHTDANDAIQAIQGELGTDPAGASATVKARLDALDIHDHDADYEPDGAVSTHAATPHGTIIAALPSAAEEFRGRLYLVAGGAGTADELYVCVKDAADAYVWVPLVWAA